MFETWKRGWALSKATLEVLKKDPEIMWLPIITAVFLLIVALPFLFLLMATELSAVLGPLGITWVPAIPWFAAPAALFGLYLAAYFIIIYFNTAVVGCANIRLAGGNPKVRDGLTIARQNIKSIFVWALITATVGVILRLVAERLQLLGRIIVSMIGLAWSIGTYFVVPVLVFEKLTPWAAVRKSVQILKSTWGEAIVGNLGVGLVIFVKLILVFLPLTAAGLILGVMLSSWIPLVLGFGAAMIWAAYMGAMSMAADGILLTALYRYGSNQPVTGFPEELLKNPWVYGKKPVSALGALPGVRTTV